MVANVTHRNAVGNSQRRHGDCRSKPRSFDRHALEFPQGASSSVRFGFTSGRPSQRDAIGQLPVIGQLVVTFGDSFVVIGSTQLRVPLSLRSRPRKSELPMGFTEYFQQTCFLIQQLCHVRDPRPRSTSPRRTAAGDGGADQHRSSRKATRLSKTGR